LHKYLLEYFSNFLCLLDAFFFRILLGHCGFYMAVNFISVSLCESILFFQVPLRFILFCTFVTQHHLYFLYLIFIWLFYYFLSVSSICEFQSWAQFSVAVVYIRLFFFSLFSLYVFVKNLAFNYLGTLGFSLVWF